MGCYGAFNGLKMAHAIVKAEPTAKVLLVCIELCTLHFQKKNDENYLLSNALFADGAAAVLIESTPRGMALEMSQFYCDLLPQGKQDMAWNVGDFGFEMVLSSYIPKLVKGGLGQLLTRLQSHATLPKIDFYAIHPGGRAILEAAEKQLHLSPDDNRYAYDVLREYGNMSSCTVLFVLQRLLAERTPTDHGKHVFSCAFGPGLTLETGVFRIVTES
jgi:predicted naringenin-chalcone synthase